MFKVEFTRYSHRPIASIQTKDVAYFPTATVALYVIALWNRAPEYVYEITKVSKVASKPPLWHADSFAFYTGSTHLCPY